MNGQGEGTYGKNCDRVNTRNEPKHVIIPVQCVSYED